MRFHLSAAVIGLLLVLPAAAGDRPIPQDPEKQEQRRRDLFAWNQRTLAGAYEKVGKKDPRWDKPAREALEAAARFFSKQTDPPAKLEDVYAPARKALDAGCDDPLILYLHARASYKPHDPGEEELGRRFTTAAAALEASAYPPFRRATALTKAGLHMAARKDLTPQARKEATRLLDAALALLPRSLEEDERNPFMELNWLDLPIEVIEGHRQLTGDYLAAFECVDAVLAKHAALKVIRLNVKGDFLIDWGWEARGTGLAPTVTPDGWKKFGQRLADARKAFEDVWAADPGNVFAATKMVTVEMALGGDRGEMEKWFERAMKAEGNNLQACSAKLEWLDPKWHGTVPDMLAFGQACRDTKNWRTGITLLLAETHRRAMQKLPPDKRSEYFKSEEIWKEIRDVFDEYLRHYPNDHAERSRYAAYCYMCGQHAEADRQFQAVGDNLVWFRSFPEKWMKQVRAHVVGKGGPPKGAKPPQ